MQGNSTTGAFVGCLLAMLVTSALAYSGLANSALTFSSQQPVQLSNVTDAELKQVVIQFQRSTCYGNCPGYSLKVFGDGRVEYIGSNFVKITGRQEGHVEQAVVRRLLDEFEKANFFGLKQYAEKGCSCTLCTDMPTVITEILLKGKAQKVEHYYGCRCAPKELWDLEAAIDKLIGTEQWTGDVSKAGPRGTTCFGR